MCAKRRLRSAWTSANSGQSLRCPHDETLVSYPLSVQRKADLSFRSAHMSFCCFCHAAAHITKALMASGSFLFIPRTCNLDPYTFPKISAFFKNSDETKKLMNVTQQLVKKYIHMAAFQFGANVKKTIRIITLWSRTWTINGVGQPFHRKE